MKTNQKVAVTIIVLVGFVVGMLIGVSLTNPGMSVFEAAGSIGKIDKYRNVKITEDDIELRNILLADESLREAYKDYLTFEYTANLKMAEDIESSLEAIQKLSAFNPVDAETIESLENYYHLLNSSRLRIMEALAVLNGLSLNNRIALQSVLNDASNALALSIYHSNVLFNFINEVELFMGADFNESFLELATSHDRLLVNLISSCIVNDNRPAVRYLMMDNQLLTKNVNLALDPQALQVGFMSDLERAKERMIDVDADQLRVVDFEQMGVFWASDRYRTFDGEQMEALLGMEKIRAFEMEEVDAFFSQAQFRAFAAEEMELAFNAEKLENIVSTRASFSRMSLK